MKKKKKKKKKAKIILREQVYFVMLPINIQLKQGYVDVYIIREVLSCLNKKSIKITNFRISL